jgi:glutamyl-tRNA synthetase
MCSFISPRLPPPSISSIQDYARTLLRNGQAFMDNTPMEQMREERSNRVESKHRNQSPEEGLALFERLVKGDPSVMEYCLRAKIDMASDNGTLRDPVLYRGNTTPHHRTGTKFHAYPTYDFVCPIVDSIEGVTHCLRTTEYTDRDFQYHILQDMLKLRKVRRLVANKNEEEEERVCQAHLGRWCFYECFSWCFFSSFS